MDVPFNASIELPPNIEPPTVLPVVSLQVVDDPRNVKAEDPSPYHHHHHHQNMIFPKVM
jgi:hypothetical protein